MILLPGVRSVRTARRSQLAFYWHARDATLLAETGQQGVLSNEGVATTGSNLVPSVGSTIVAGSRQPRFTRVAPDNVLEMTGITAGKDIERLTFPFGLVAADLTVLYRFTGLWTLGGTLAAQGGLFSIGTAIGDGAGAIRFQRSSGTNYFLSRSSSGGTSSDVSLAESDSLSWPVDALVSYTASTGIAHLTLRGANGFLTSTINAGGSAHIFTSSRWAQQQMTLGYDGSGSVPGQPHRLYFCKIATGEKTFAQMDLLF